MHCHLAFNMGGEGTSRVHFSEADDQITILNPLLYLVPLWSYFRARIGPDHLQVVVRIIQDALATNVKSKRVGGTHQHLQYLGARALLSTHLEGRKPVPGESRPGCRVGSEHCQGLIFSFAEMARRRYATWWRTAVICSACRMLDHETSYARPIFVGFFWLVN